MERLLERVFITLVTDGFITTPPTMKEGDTILRPGGTVARLLHPFRCSWVWVREGAFTAQIKSATFIGISSICVL